MLSAGAAEPSPSAPIKPRSNDGRPANSASWSSASVLITRRSTLSEVSTRTWLSTCSTATSLIWLVGLSSLPTACKSVGSMRIWVVAVYRCGTARTKTAISNSEAAVVQKMVFLPRPTRSKIPRKSICARREGPRPVLSLAAAANSTGRGASNIRHSTVTLAMSRAGRRWRDDLSEQAGAHPTRINTHAARHVRAFVPAEIHKALKLTRGVFPRIRHHRRSRRNPERAATSKIRPRMGIQMMSAPRTRRSATAARTNSASNRRMPPNGPTRVT